MQHFKLPVLGWIFSLSLVSAAPTTCNVNGYNYNIDNVITRDVSIIGGGSAGTYTAIRLGDLGKSVVVIEAIARLGGNTQTYRDPATGLTIDYGVQVFHPFDIVYNYFTRLNVSVALESPSSASSVTKYADFSTSTASNYAPANYTLALELYAAQVALYPYLDYGWNLTYPVPDDLTSSFGSFVKKYSLDAMVPFAWVFTQGIGDILKVPTVYVLKYLGLSSLSGLQTGFLTTVAQDNSLIYDSAAKILGSNVLYNSNILDVERDSNGVQIVVTTGSTTTLIKSSKLVVAIQPALSNLKFLDLTEEENELFKLFKSSEYFTGILKNTNLTTSLQNYSPTLPYNLPVPPSLYSIQQTTVPDLDLVTYIATDGTTTQSQFENTILDEVKKLNVPGGSGVEFVVSSVHQPFELHVRGEDIKEGFYRNLLGLQGKKNTFWASATLHAHDSSLIWRYIEEDLLASIAA